MKMRNKKDFFEGMGSALDLKGSAHFNEYKEYPGAKASISNYWHNTGSYINTAFEAAKIKSNIRVANPSQKPPTQAVSVNLETNG
ncbi:hypothetical protein CYPRO_3239 [Cyclonatronum proteinivorum]|uniref:Uncharacterized protein n=1 Tax=Cyclonatronum proteinivorum TaxID=1457365 RepID=A0A345UPS0_9BACT|nr:hypothetical protein [Cyclonatronum proteinivorum]AXJ02472.1 hypothetical protein CYPRO_3239 [Cyclonatronum proteinivorum]